MKTFRWLLVLSFVFLSLGTGPIATAQSGEPSLTSSYDRVRLYPGGNTEITVTVTNTTDSPIVLYGVAMSGISAPERCPSHWFGDGAYYDMPRGEDESNPPVPPYDLPSVPLAEPVVLQPGESFSAPTMNLYMIWAAPNSCQRVSITPSYSANWEFVNVQAYSTVSGTIGDSVSSAPISDGTVTITGTTDNGIESETVSTVDGIYASTLQFHANTVVTVEASAPGYEATSGTVTVVEGANTLDLTLVPLPPAVVGVSGTVTNAISGAPIPGASVTLTGTGADGTPFTITLTANEDGAWGSDAVFAVGTDVSVSATASGYQEATVTTTIAPEGVSGLSLQLVADPIETPVPETPIPTEDPTETPGTETPAPTEDPIETPGTETPVPTEQPTENPGTETPVPTEAPTETPGTETPAPTEVPTEAVVPTATTPPSDPGDNSGSSPVTSLPETGAGAQSSNIYLPLAVMTVLALGAIGMRLSRRS